MKNYAVTTVFTNVAFIEAADEAEAEELALAEMETEYGLAPGQAYMDEIKEVK